MNTWHFISNAVDRLDDANAILAELETFYNAVETIWPAVLTGTATVKCYDLEDPEPRSPLFTDDFGFTPQGGISLPNECAIAMSYGRSGISGIPIGRRRGRIFLGPLDGDTADVGGAGVIVDPGVCTIIADAGQALMNAGVAETWKWAVWSPTSAGPPPWSPADLIAGALSVNHGHVDNAFDTIRSRGIAASERVSW